MRTGEVNLDLLFDFLPSKLGKIKRILIGCEAAASKAFFLLSDTFGGYSAGLDASNFPHRYTDICQK